MSTCPQTMASISPALGDCKFDPGQAILVLFQKIYSTGTTRNGVAIASATDVANWTALLAASDKTKIIATNKFGEGVVEPGELIEFGGGNATPEGVPIPRGKKNAKLTGMMFNSKQDAIKELKKLENINSGLGIYIVTHLDEIYGQTVSISSTDTLCPMPIVGAPYFLDAKAFQKEDPLSNNFGVYLPENYSDILTGVTCEGIKGVKNV